MNLTNDADTSRKKLVFFHIPKTGGTTLRKILLQMYGDSYFYCNDPRVDSIREALHRYDCVEFHVGEFQGRDLYFHQEIISHQNRSTLSGWVQYVMFRDPVDRVISNYFQLKRKREMERKPNASETIAEAITKPETHNKQVGYLLGAHPSERCSFNKKDLEDAKNFLIESRTVVGIMEKYSESLGLLQAVTGRAIPSEPIRIENQTSKQDLFQVDQLTRDLIREKNSLDQELYEFACGLFREQCLVAEIQQNGNFQFICNG